MVLKLNVPSMNRATKQERYRAVPERRLYDWVDKTCQLSAVLVRRGKNARRLEVGQNWANHHAEQLYAYLT